MIFVRSCPARPTNGRPWLSSSSPGASPTKTSLAFALPSPKTRLRRVPVKGTPGAIAQFLADPGQGQRRLAGAGFRRCLYGRQIPLAVFLPPGNGFTLHRQTRDGIVGILFVCNVISQGAHEMLQLALEIIFFSHGMPLFVSPSVPVHGPGSARQRPSCPSGADPPSPLRGRGS